MDQSIIQFTVTIASSYSVEHSLQWSVLECVKGGASGSEVRSHPEAEAFLLMNA